MTFGTLARLLRDGGVGGGLQQDDAVGGGQRQARRRRLGRHQHHRHLGVAVERRQRLGDGLQDSGELPVAQALVSVGSAVPQCVTPAAGPKEGL